MSADLFQPVNNFFIFVWGPRDFSNNEDNFDIELRFQFPFNSFAFRPKTF